MNYKIIPFVLYLFLTSLICNAQWSELNGINPPNFNEAVYSVITDLKGNLYAAGSFTNTNGNGCFRKRQGYKKKTGTVTTRPIQCNLEYPL